MKGLGGLVLLLVLLWALGPRPGGAGPQFKVGDLVRLAPQVGLEGIYVIVEMASPERAIVADAANPTSLPRYTIATMYLIRV